MKKKNNDWIVGVLIGIIIALAIILLIFILKGNKEVTFGEEEFKIISASWDTYSDYNSLEFPDERIDWDYACEEGHEDYISCSYTLITQQSEDLRCYGYFNGEVYPNSYKENGAGYGWSFDKDKKDYKCLANLELKQANEITICCHPSECYTRDGLICEDCDTITLPAKCS